MKIARIKAFFILALLSVVVFVPAALANSAEPPGLTIIVSFPPEDLAVSIRFADGRVAQAVPLQMERKGWEAYYRLFYGAVGVERPALQGAMLVVESGSKSFERALPDYAFSQYNNILTLDIAGESIAQGQSPLRSVLLVSMRVLLTLLIEGIIFFAFGYRSKASWIVFFVVNLVTQGVLNVLLSGPNLGTYWFFGFVIYEVIIIVVEMIAFMTLLKEHKKSVAAVYALGANIASLVLGGILISYLPV